MKKRKLLIIWISMIMISLGMIAYGILSSDEEPPTEAGIGEKRSSDLDQLEQKYVRSDEGQGGVQVTAILLSSEYLKAAGRESTVGDYNNKNSLVFEITMSTHMGDLRIYPIMEEASLSVDGRSLKPVDWKLTADDPHHPVGLLVYTIPGSDITQKSSTLIKLRLANLAGVSERELAWTL